MQNDKKNKIKILIFSIIGVIFGVIITCCTILVSKCINKPTNDVCENGHQYIDYVVKPTCLDNGYTFHQCSNCNVNYIDKKTGTVNHLYDYEIIKEATCTTEGLKKGICKYCGVETEEIIAKTEHIIEETHFSEEKCGEHNIGIARCSICSEVVLSYGHQYELYITQAECEKDGCIKYICKSCNDEKIEIIPAHGHSESKMEIVSLPTCTEYGYQESSCDICGKSMQSKYIDKIPHNFQTQIVGNELHLTCNVCNIKQINTLEKDYFVISFDTLCDLVIHDYYVFNEDYVELPEPTRDNYYFDGWYYDKDYSLRAFNNELKDDTMLYAKWNEINSVEISENILRSEVDLDFEILVNSDIVLSNDNLSKYIQVVDKYDNIVYSYVSSVNDNIYGIKLLNSNRGQIYTVTIQDPLSFIDTKEKTINIITKNTEQFNYSLKDDVIKISNSLILGTYEKEDGIYIILKEDILNTNDKVVVYNDNNSEVTAFFQVVDKYYDNNYYLYNIQEIDYELIFSEYYGYYSGNIDTNKIVFNQDFEEELVKKLKRSPLYKQFNYAINNLQLNNEDYSYEWSDVKVKPIKSTKDDGIFVKISISSDCIKINNKTGQRSVEFTVVLDIDNLFSFNVQHNFDYITNFYCILGIDSQTNIKLYACNNIDKNVDKEFHYFKEVFYEAHAKGTNDELPSGQSPTHSEEQVVGSVGTFVYGFYIGLDIKLHFDFSMIGETGVDITIYSNLKSGITVNGMDSIRIIKDFKSSVHSSIYIMGKLETSGSVSVDATVSFLGLVHITASLEAGPYLEIGGYIGVNNIGSEDEHKVFAGYIEIGAKVKVAISLGLELQIRMDLYLTEIEYTISKSWNETIYDEEFELINVGDKIVPLYFVHNEETLNFEFGCTGNIDFDALVDNKIYVQNLDTNSKSVIDAKCWYFMPKEVQGINLSKDGTMKIANTHSNIIKFEIRVYYGDGLIFKTLNVQIKLFHSEQLVLAKTPNCYEEGHNEHIICVLCGDTINSEKIIYPKYHPVTIELMNSKALRTNKTCITKESYWKTCTQCNNLSDTEYFEIGELDEHKFQSEYDCVDKKCTICNFVIHATKLHNYENSYCECGTKLYSEGLIFELQDNGYYSVVGYEDYIESSIVIPAYYNNVKVISIKSRAFAGCKAIEINVSEGIEIFEHEAFAYCEKLEVINIPTSLKEIGLDIFAHSINISFNMYEEGKYLGNKDNPYLALFSIGNNKLESYNIHQDTEIIWSTAFNAATNLTYFKVPQKIRVIGDFAFRSCDNLLILMIGENVTNVGHAICFSDFDVEVLIDYNCDIYEWNSSWMIIGPAHELTYSRSDITYE